MNIMIRDLAVPTLSRGLLVAQRYCALLAKKAATMNVSTSFLLDARLSNDFATFHAHIEGVIDVAHAAVVALAGLPDHGLPSTEPDLDALRRRLEQTIADVGQTEGVVFIDTSEKIDYVVETMLPAFYLHLVSAHAILRSLGAPVGKHDYLGDLDGLYEVRDAA